MQKFFFLRDGIPEEVPAERWRWIAVYKGGAALCQFEESSTGNGIFHQFKEIDQDRLERFIMHSAEDSTKLYVIHITPGMRLIHYYRNTVLNAGTELEERIRAYCFGYAETIEGRSRKTIIQIYPDDTCHIINDDGKE